MCDRYITPYIDYGFKKLFATEENKDLLISLLNAIIGGEDPIKDLIYKNVEQIGEIIGTRTNYFDVYCETASGEQFIVEMQNSWQPFFKDRVLYYAAKPIRDQLKKGIRKVEDDIRKGRFSKDYKYELENVYVVAMMNFRLPDKEYPEESYIHRIQLMDVEDLHVFYDKLTLIYVELPKIDHAQLDLSTPLGQWLHALNHLYYYHRKPDDLKGEVFDKLFRQAELANFTPEQDLTYERSMKVFLDTIGQLKGARILGEKEGEKIGLAKGKELGLVEGKELGIAEGKELGLAEGKELGLAEGKELGLAEGKRETARKMLSLGIDWETIRQVTGLTEGNL